MAQPMGWRIEDNRAERAVDAAAAATFAGAVGFAAWAVAPGAGRAAAAVAAAFAVAYFGLRRISAGIRIYPLPVFPLETIAPLPEVQGGAADELVLEDRLAQVSPHARVVRLFGPSQSHLRPSHKRPAPPDASQALSEALAELRRSLH